MSHRTRPEFLPGFIETVNLAIKELGIDEVAEKLRLPPRIVRKYAAGAARPVEHKQRDIMDVLEQLLQ